MTVEIASFVAIIVVILTLAAFAWTDWRREQKRERDKQDLLRELQRKEDRDRTY